jgi:hypothetical protein
MTGFAEQLEAQRRSLVTEIRELQEVIAEKTARVGQLQLKLESVLELMKLEGAAPATTERHFIEVAHDVLIERGELHYVDLAAEVQARGVFIPGAKPEANLLAHMSRDTRFEKVARGRYTIVGARRSGDRKSSKRTRRGNGHTKHIEQNNGAK